MTYCDLDNLLMHGFDMPCLETRHETGRLAISGRKLLVSGGIDGKFGWGVCQDGTNGKAHTNFTVFHTEFITN